MCAVVVVAAMNPFLDVYLDDSLCSSNSRRKSIK